MFAAPEVLTEVDDNSALIVGDPQGILGQQLRPHSIHFFNFIIIILITYKTIIYEIVNLN